MTRFHRSVFSRFFRVMLRAIAANPSRELNRQVSSALNGLGRNLPALLNDVERGNTNGVELVRAAREAPLRRLSVLAAAVALCGVILGVAGVRAQTDPD